MGAYLPLGHSSNQVSQSLTRTWHLWASLTSTHRLSEPFSLIWSISFQLSETPLMNFLLLFICISQRNLYLDSHISIIFILFMLELPLGPELSQSQPSLMALAWPEDFESWSHEKLGKSHGFQQARTSLHRSQEDQDKPEMPAEAPVTIIKYLRMQHDHHKGSKKYVACTKFTDSHSPCIIKLP